MTGRSTAAGRWMMAALAGLGVALFLLPVLGILLRTPWSRLPEQLATASVHDAIRLSLWSSVCALAVAIVFGLPLAVWLSRGRTALRSAVRIVVLLPIVLPPVVGGIALLLAFGRNGVVGVWLQQWFGVALPFTPAGAALAAAYMGMPFFVLSAEAGLRSFDQRFVGAAATLGAGPARRFFRVLLPMVMPQLCTGGLLCWARALGEFCATQTFAGNLAGQTRTLPLACAIAMETEPDLAVVLSLILAVISVLVLFLMRHTWWPSR